MGNIWHAVNILNHTRWMAAAMHSFTVSTTAACYEFRVNCSDLSSLMKDKSQMIEKLESALEKQQDGRVYCVDLTHILNILVSACDSGTLHLFFTFQWAMCRGFSSRSALFYSGCSWCEVALVGCCHVMVGREHRLSLLMLILPTF